jgi:hypothetical protein
VRVEEGFIDERPYILTGQEPSYLRNSSKGAHVNVSEVDGEELIYHPNG